MNDENAPNDLPEQPKPIELPAIEFESPGRFAVHNPQSLTPDSPQAEPAPYVLGAHAALERFSQPEQARAHALALLQQAGNVIYHRMQQTALAIGDGRSNEPLIDHHRAIVAALDHMHHAHAQPLISDSRRWNQLGPHVCYLR